MFDKCGQILSIDLTYHYIYNSTQLSGLAGSASHYFSSRFDNYVRLELSLAKACLTHSTYYLYPTEEVGGGFRH